MPRFALRWTSALLLLASASFGAEAKNVRDYGAVPDDGQDDTVAFQKALQQGGTVYVPAGTFQLSVGGRPSLFAVTCPKSLKLVGEGRDRTRIATEQTLTATGNAFLFAASTQVELHDLTIQGPRELNGFYSVGIIHYGGSKGSLRIERCAIRGGHMAVRMEELNGKQESPQTSVLDSVLESPTCLLALNSGQCNVIRTEFRGYGTPGSNQTHAIYTYLPVSLLVDQCVFAGSAGLGFDLHIYSNWLPGTGRVEVRNSQFLGAGTRSILTHAETLTRINDCQLGMTVIQVRRGGALFVGCTLYSARYVVPWPYYPPGPGTWEFRNCQFEEE